MKDVNSPVNTASIGSRLSNPLPFSPGARSSPGNPLRGDRAPEQPAQPVPGGGQKPHAASA